MKRLLVGAGILGLLGYAFYRGTRPAFYKTLVAPPAGGSDKYQRMSVEVPEGEGPWFPDKLSKPENGLREPGKRYMARIHSYESTGGGNAIVEGYWKGDASSNKVAGKLHVDRVIDAQVKRPTVPFDLLVPPSSGSLDNDYLETTRWASMHATSVGESPRVGRKPKVGSTVRYAMRERNPLGVAVIVLAGKVLREDSPYWPKDEGEPDEERVLVSADDIARSVRGGGQISLPAAFVIPVENLIEESPLA